MKFFSKESTSDALPNQRERLPLRRINYILLGIGCAIILIGFLLMIGGKSNDPNLFNEAIYGFQRITLAPTLVVIGFFFEIFAILYRPKNNSSQTETNTPSKK